jgi:predicted unusual protein kinase regulating ubiquinone biosynthesis (AarF/ABC1/UbiB family)
MQGGGGDKVVPRVFVDTLKVLTDQAPSRSFADVDSVLVEDLGASGLQLFASIESKPIAAASLAQVHVAMTHDGRKCALKVQYPELRANMASDLAVFRTMGSQACAFAQSSWIFDCILTPCTDRSSRAAWTSHGW